jgi:hypothetical protein
MHGDIGILKKWYTYQKLLSIKYMLRVTGVLDVVKRPRLKKLEHDVSETGSVCLQVRRGRRLRISIARYC